VARLAAAAGTAPAINGVLGRCPRQGSSAGGGSAGSRTLSSWRGLLAAGGGGEGPPRPGRPGGRPRAAPAPRSTRICRAAHQHSSNKHT